MPPKPQLQRPSGNPQYHGFIVKDFWSYSSAIVSIFSLSEWSGRIQANPYVCGTISRHKFIGKSNTVNVSFRLWFFEPERGSVNLVCWSAQGTIIAAELKQILWSKSMILILQVRTSSHPWQLIKNKIFESPLENISLSLVPVCAGTLSCHNNF